MALFTDFEIPVAEFQVTYCVTVQVTYYVTLQVTRQSFGSTALPSA
jgi:hypothetical protein